MFKFESYISRSMLSYGYIQNFVDHLLSLDEFNYISILHKDSLIENPTSDNTIGWSIELLFMNIFKIKIIISTGNNIEIYQAPYNENYPSTKYCRQCIVSSNYTGLTFYLIENESFCFFTARPHNANTGFRNGSSDFGTFIIKNGNRKFYSYYASSNHSYQESNKYLSTGLVDIESKIIYDVLTTFPYSTSNDTYILSSDKIIYRNKIIFTGNTFEMQFNDEILDTNKVNVGNHFSIDGHKYFSIAENTMLKYE